MAIINITSESSLAHIVKTHIAEFMKDETQPERPYINFFRAMIEVSADPSLANEGMINAMEIAISEMRTLIKDEETV